LAENAKRAVENARQHVARLLGCDSDEVIFTSGATESNNMILKGVLDYYREMEQHLVITKTEHPSILETARYLEKTGVKVSVLDVDRYGRISPTQLKEVINSTKPLLVSVIWGNNEIGSLNNIEEIAFLCNHHDVFFHTDATQVVGKIKIDMSKLGIKFLSCSAHKIHGPKGIGACVIRKNKLGIKTKITPLLHGGGQEGNYRSGTLSVHDIVGFGKAAELAYQNLEHVHNHLRKLEEYLTNKLSSLFPGIVSFNNDTKDKIPGIVNIRFKGISNELLIKRLADHFALSTGSACSSSKPSHVLQSIGLKIDEIRSSIRISLSQFNSIDDIDQFCTILSTKNNS
jgi:cysteine desulfurase